MDPIKRERGLDLEAYLNPKSSMSSFSTFMHVLWLRKWKIAAIWALLALPAAVFLALYDIPRTYSSVSYLRFPRVTGVQNTVVRDVSMGEAESVVRLFKSERVLMKTIKDMSLQMQVASMGVFRKHVIRSVTYGPGTMPGRYRFEFPGDRRVRVLHRPWRARSYTLLSESVADTGHSVAIPGGRIAFPPQLLDVSRGSRVDMIFQTPAGALEDFGKRLAVKPLDKGPVAVNYAVEFEDRDPFLVAEVVNRLTANFMAAYAGTGENQDQGVLARLESSMEAARANLDQAQEKLAEFYRKNQGRMSAKEGNPYALSNAQAQKTQLQTNLERLSQTLSGKPGEGADEEEKSLWMSEALALLSGQGVQRAEAMRNRLTDLERRKIALSAEHSSVHPYVLAVDEEAAGFFGSVARLAEETRGLYRSKLSQAEAEIARSVPGGGGDMGLSIEAARLAEDRDNAARGLDNLRAEYDRAKLGAGPGLFEVEVMDAARPPLYEPPSLGTRLGYAGVAVLLALFPGLIWAMVSQILFPRIWTKDDAERKLKVKVAGSLFHIEGKAGKQRGHARVDDRLLHYGRLPGPADVEAYRSLRVELEHRFDPEPGREAMCLLVTSTQPSEGKSLVAANLAVGFARRGRRTLLVDADFRHGRQESLFGHRAQRGLIDLLRGGVDPDFGRRAHAALIPTVQPNLMLMPKGAYDDSAVEAAYRAPMEYYLKSAKAAFEVVIVDGPPVIVTADPLSLARITRAVLFVLRSGQVTAREAERALEPFKDRGIPLLAAVNGIHRSPSDDNYYARYGYYYLTHPETPVKKADPRETHVGI